MATLDKSGLIKEITFKTSRSAGKGGQNVNKVETKIELLFHISNSQFLNENQKEILIEKLKNKINNKGELILTEQSERSQLANKEKIIKKFFRTLDKALEKKKIRKASQPTKASKLKKRVEKEQRSDIKKNRSKNYFSN